MHGRDVRAGILAAALLAVLLPSAQAASVLPNASAVAQVLRERNSDALRGLIIASGAQQLKVDQGADGPITGMAPIEDLLLARPEVLLDPAYWTNYVREVLLHFHVLLPLPLDPVKPEAFLVNVPVANGDYVSALPQAVQDISQITYEWRGSTKTVQQFVHSTETDVVAIVQNGVLVGEVYANGYSPEVRHQPWSVTKTFIAATVGIAFQEGLIRSLQDPIDLYIPELAGTAWEGVTIENLLQMESGVHWDEDTPVLAINTQVEQWVDLALDLYSGGLLGRTRNAFLKNLPKVYEQGTEFRYNSGNTQVLAWLTEVLYGKTYNEVIAEKLWAPMGAAGDAVMIADRVGGVVASQGLYARPYDLARFGELMRNAGRTPEGRRVLSPDWIRAMTSMTEVSNGRYGYQTWSAPVAGPDVYTASGFQGQKITVMPSQCITAVRLSHTFGLAFRDGDDPFDPDAYGFATNFGADEFNTMLRAVADSLPGCKAGGGNDPPTSSGGGALLPAGLMLFAGLGAALRRRRAAVTG
jgi:CubicO group peptidase (beta-lactamase class C family)